MGLLGGLGSLAADAVPADPNVNLIFPNTAPAAAAPKSWADQLTSALTTVAADVPIIRGQVPPPGFTVDPKTGKFIPVSTTTGGGSGGGGGGSGDHEGFEWKKYLPWIVGGVAVAGLGFFAFKRIKRKR